MNDLLQSMFEHGHISAEDVIAARTQCAEQFCSAVRCLRELNLAAPDKIQFCLNEYLHFQVATGAEVDALDERLGDIIPEDIAFHLRVFCMGGVKNRLVVAMEDPTDLATRRKLEFFLEKKIVPVAATHDQITKALGKLYKIEQTEKTGTEPTQSAPREIIATTPPHLTPKQSIEDDVDLVTQKVATSNENQEAAEVTLENVSIANNLQNSDDDLFGEFDDNKSASTEPMDADITRFAESTTDENPVSDPGEDTLFAGFGESQTPVTVSDESTDETLPLSDDLPTIEIDRLDVVSAETESLPLINLELASRIAVAFVKIGFVKNQEEAINVINEKLADLLISVEVLDKKRFAIKTNSQSFEVDLDQDNQPTQVEALTPILNSIARMAKSS